MIAQVPDLVFMDLHMPVQHGLQATQTLRALRAAAGPVPIVGLTADAFTDTRRRVLAPGMHKYLSKPVQPVDTGSWLVARFGHRAHGARPAPAPQQSSGAAAPTMSSPSTPASIPPSSPSLSPSSATPQGPASAETGAASRRRFRASDVATHLDMAVIGDVCVGVGLAGYRSVVVGFLGDESGNQAALLAALDQANSEAVRDRAHAVKGAAASLGLRAVCEAASRLEVEAAHWGDVDRAAAAAELRGLLATARALLQRMGFA